MKSSRKWLALWAMWLLTLSCVAPRALTSVGETEPASTGTDTLEVTRPPPSLGGPPNGKTFRVPAPYHQLITNAFREQHPYGRPTPSVEEAQRLMLKVYSKYPIPQLIGIQDP